MYEARKWKEQRMRKIYTLQTCLKKLKPEILTGWKKRIPPDNIFSFNRCSFGGESQKIDWTNERSRSAD